MPCIQWFDVTVCDMNPANMLEDQIKALAAYGGIHDFDFPSYIDDPCTGLISDTWDDADSEGTWSYTSSKLQCIGGGGPQWYGIVSQLSVGEAGVIIFDKEDDGNTIGGVLIRATDKNDGYLVYWDSNSIGVSFLTAGTPVNLIDLPKVYTGNSNVRVAWREQQYTSTDPHRWLFISIWFDGELGLTIGDRINDRTLGDLVGFATYGSATEKFSNIRVPRLGTIGDWASLDENEAPGGAIERLIGKRHVAYWLRYDGTMKVIVPGVLASSRTLTTAMIEEMARTLDRRGLLSRVRVQGAYVAAEAIDPTIAKLVGHRYRRADSPHLMTEQECAEEAAYLLDRAEEGSDVVDLLVPMRVLLEPQDVITLPSGDYRIIKLHHVGTGSSLLARMEVHKYVT